MKKRRKRNAKKRIEDSSSSEEEEEADDDELFERSPTVPEQCQNCVENVAFDILYLTVGRGRVRRTYLERLKWTYCIKDDAVYRKVI